MGQHIGKLKELRVPLIIFLTFWAIAIGVWKTSGNIFFLFNFGYIGTAVGVGIGLYALLPRKKKPAGRRFAQLLVGIYMLGFLGVFKIENMQLEGFFFYLLSGFFPVPLFITSSQKYLGQFYLGGVFAAGRAGRQWHSTFYRIKETRQEG